MRCDIRAGFSIACLFLTVGCGGASSPDAEAARWAEAGRQDLQFIYDTIDANHPGPLDTANPAFAAWHREGFDEATAKVNQAPGQAGYVHSLRYYAYGFADGHLSIYLEVEPEEVEWAGLMLAWRGDRFVVHHRADDVDVPTGATLVRCDGESPETLWVRNVLPYYAKGDLPSQRYRHAPRVLIDHGNPFVERPVDCRFEHEGQAIDTKLAWRTISRKDLNEPFVRATRSPRGSFEIREVSGGGIWVTLPTFGPQGDDAETMKRILAELQQYRDAPYVVADVRGNGGGSSYWTKPFVEHLYGETFFAYQKAQHDARSQSTYPTFRASRDNVTHFEALLPRIESDAGKDSDFYGYFARLVEELDAAVTDGEQLLDLKDTDEGEEEEPPADAAPEFGGQLFFLTDSACGSACLDFADVVLRLPGVVHVGQPTSADTTYMEVRSEPLPSDQGRLTFATKVYRNRPRGHNEYYTPQYAFDGDIGDTPALESWIRSLKTD